MYDLSVSSSIRGGYLSSEQIDLLTIIQCDNFEELTDFISKCDQINQNPDLINNARQKGSLEEAKRYIFKVYQDTMTYHDQTKNESRIRRLEYLGIMPSELMDVIERRYPNSERILELNHHFISEERDQNKSEGLYEELSAVNENLSSFNSLLLGSGKIYTVVNKYYKEKRFDFYHMERDLEFARRNGKQVRYHALLVKEDASHLFDNKSKEEILQILKDYVKASIDFIREYNSTHSVEIDGVKQPVINAVDLFNEIVSFEKNEQGEYYNIWESQYGISMDELLSVFEYARINKPDGVSYVYNEPFLEEDERRKKVFETLDIIDSKSPGLIDTLGSQMHITISEEYPKIERCFADFKELQDKKGKKIQITEFDMSIGMSDIPRVFGEQSKIGLEQIYEIKRERINQISNIIKNSGVILSGVSYWSLTDGIDFNLERIRSSMLEEGKISDVSQIPTVCGGLIPTYIENMKKQNKDNIQNIVEEESNKLL